MLLYVDNKLQWQVLLTIPMINFTERENCIFEIIKKYALNQSPIVTPRLAGGFVRDKIMGLECHDIDVALDNVSGLTFAEGLSEVLKEHPSVHKISANPEKSKHLETAVIHMMGYSIDFVHLRSETYTETRIPQINPGTPLEDASRRDITINTLFYNLITNEIEDFTGRGLDDIRNGIIDTPLDPRITLFDDPLRILRIFRFKSKMGFEIKDRIYDAIKDQRIKEALRKKVSNERNGIEIWKMIQYPRGEDGMFEIIKNDLVLQVFKYKTSLDLGLNEARRFWSNILDLKDTFNDKLSNLSVKKLEMPLLKLYIVFQYFISSTTNNLKKSEFENVVVMRDGLKMARNIFNAVKNIEENMKWILDSNPTDCAEIVAKCGEYWLESLMILYSKFENCYFRDLIHEIFEKGIQESYLQKPTVNGNFLISLGVDQKDFKNIIFRSFVEQIKNPHLTENEIYERVCRSDEN